MDLAQWFVAGVAFGVKAFFAVLVFVLCAGVILGVLGLIASAFKGE